MNHQAFIGCKCVCLFLFRSQIQWIPSNKFKISAIKRIRHTLWQKYTHYSYHLFCVHRIKIIEPLLLSTLVIRWRSWSFLNAMFYFMYRIYWIKCQHIIHLILKCLIANMFNNNWILTLLHSPSRDSFVLCVTKKSLFNLKCNRFFFIVFE